MPLTGRSPGSFDDGVRTFPVETRDDGIYVGLPDDEIHVRSVSDVVAETLVAWGVRHVWGMVGHSNLGLADGIRRQVEAGRMSYYGIRHEGAASFAASAYGKLTGRPAACSTMAAQRPSVGSWWFVLGTTRSPRSSARLRAKGSWRHRRIRRVCLVCSGRCWG